MGQACFSGTQAYEDETDLSPEELEYWQKRNERIGRWKKKTWEKMKNKKRTKDEKICFFFCYPWLWHYFHH